MVCDVILKMLKPRKGHALTHGLLYHRRAELYSYNVVYGLQTSSAGVNFI